MRHVTFPSYTNIVTTFEVINSSEAIPSVMSCSKLTTMVQLVMSYNS